MSTAPRRIVVAVDGSVTSRIALRRAAEEAIAHSASLEVLLAWGLLDQMTAVHFNPHLNESHARANLERIIDEELGDNRPPSLVWRVENDLPARAILAAAQGAWLVVVGSRGLGGFKGLLIGSVSSQVAHHAPCPILVVPGPDRPSTVDMR